MKSNNIVLSGKNIIKVYGETAVLNSLDITVYDGDFIVIMGSSGSGKSTLLYMLSGMDRVTGGKVVYDGRNLSDLSEKELTVLRGNAFGFVFQKTYLVSSLTLYENILMAGLVNTSMTETQVREQAEKLLRQMKLTHVKNHLPSQVSGGEAQRAAVARAVIGSPGLLFADEPTGALNRANTKEVLNLFTALHVAQNIRGTYTRDDEVEVSEIHAGELYLFSDGQLRLYFKDIADAKITATPISYFSGMDDITELVQTAYEENRDDSWNVDVYFLITKK